MTYQLAIGDRLYSSWSLRGWLLFEQFGIPWKMRKVDFLDAAGVAEQLREFAPARTVPALRTPEGAVIGDSLAIAEELSERHPEAGLWPRDPRARATARALAAEMHAGFAALREHCPMNLLTAYRNVPVPEAVQADLERIERIWSHARQIAPEGPWLCGAYSVADAFYAPVAARIAGYDLPVSEPARAYVAAHLADPAFSRWRAMGLANGQRLTRYDRDYATCDWPGPRPLPARAVTDGSPENDRCPYSGDKVTDLLELDGRIFGFCNPFCRDKTVADPDAWPAFMALYRRDC